MCVIHTSKLCAKAIFCDSSHGSAKHNFFAVESYYNKIVLFDMIARFHEKPYLTNVSYAPAVRLVNLYRHININLHSYTRVTPPFSLHTHLCLLYTSDAA